MSSEERTVGDRFSFVEHILRFFFVGFRGDALPFLRCLSVDKLIEQSSFSYKLSNAICFEDI